MHTFEDRSLSVFALGLVAILGWRIVAGLPERAIEAGAAPRFSVLELDMRVARIAKAIAIAEGYYAPGRHGGRSLAHFLNNPGLLKASPMADEEMPTWNGTGLLVFPTARVGWAALHYQVCAMLVGASRIYDLTDTLTTVGRKYADGDPNWAPNVAQRLGVTTAVRLEDLAEGLPATPASIATCRRIASDPGGVHGAQVDVVD